MNFVKENIEKLVKGEVMLSYSKRGNGFELKFLREVLGEAFPNSSSPNGTSYYYYASEINKGKWGSTDFNRDDRPTLELKEFVVAPPECPENFKFGDIILVRDSEHVSWEERIFMAYVGGKTPYVVSTYSDEVGEDFKNGNYSAVSYKIAKKKAVKVKLTRKEIAEKFGVEDFEITE